jgi:hypothetical protein
MAVFKKKIQENSVMLHHQIAEHDCNINLANHSSKNVEKFK